MGRHLDDQQRRNRMSRDNWLLAAPHRSVVTDLLIAAGRRGDIDDSPARDSSDSDARPPHPRPLSPGRERGDTACKPRLAVLGAGNCNDLDLSRLLGTFENIHLIDLDDESLAWGVGHQGVASDARLSLHGGVDLSGIADAVVAWSPATPPTDGEMDDFKARAATSPLPNLPGSCAVVASVCLLTQMLEPIINGLTPQHPRFLDVLGTVRRRHLQLLAELCEPDGTLVLVTDVVSSSTCPELATVSESQLAEFVGRQIQQHNFFTGVNPFVLRQILESDPAVASMVSEVRLSLPWRWQLGPRTYAVVALTARQRAAR